MNRRSFLRIAAAAPLAALACKLGHKPNIEPKPEPSAPMPLADDGLWGLSPTSYAQWSGNAFNCKSQPLTLEILEDGIRKMKECHGRWYA